MPVEQTSLLAGEGSFTAKLERPAVDTDHGAILLSGANHTSFDGAVFDRLAAAAADDGILFLRYQTWDNGEELAGKPTDEVYAEVDAAIEHLHKRGCSRVSLVGKSIGGAIALQHAPDVVDEMVLWAPAIFLENGDVLADLDIPDGATPATISADELAEIDIPVNILQGDEDDIPVKNARELSAELPDASLHIVEGADHSFTGSGVETESIEMTLEVLSRSDGKQ